MIKLLNIDVNGDFIEFTFSNDSIVYINGTRFSVVDNKCYYNVKDFSGFNFIIVDGNDSVIQLDNANSLEKIYKNILGVNERKSFTPGVLIFCCLVILFYKEISIIERKNILAILSYRSLETQNRELAKWCLNEIENIFEETNALPINDHQIKNTKYHSQFTLCMLISYISILILDEDKLVSSLKKSLSITSESYGKFKFKESYFNFVKVHAIIAIYKFNKGESVDSIYKYSFTLAKEAFNNFNFDSDGIVGDITLKEFSTGLYELGMIKSLPVGRTSEQILFNKVLRFDRCEELFHSFKTFKFDKVIDTPEL